MLNLRGDICISNNVNDLDKCRFTHKIIVIGEADSQMLASYNAISGGLFIPPYEAVMCEMDGNIEGFCAVYYKHLWTIECQEYIALIFKALHEGKRILLYLSKDESELTYSKAFLDFMSSTFGLQISPDINIEAGFNQAFSSIVCDLLYSFDLFNSFEFFMNRGEEPLTQATIQKLVNELNPFVQTRTIEEYQKYFSHLQRMIAERNVPVVNGLIFEER